MTFPDLANDNVTHGLKNDNVTHGLKRSNDDKRRAVERCLELQPGWTQEKVAEWAGVTHPFVGNVVAEQAALAAAKAQTSGSETVSEPDVSTTGGKPTGDEGSKKAGGMKSNAKRVGAALAADPAKADEAVATATKTTAKFVAVCGCKPALVARIRKRLVKDGVIPGGHS